MPLNFQVNFARNPPEIQPRDSRIAEAIPREQHSRPHLANIDGSTVMFNSVEEKFRALVAEWHRLRARGSSTDPLVNDAYGQIVAMGWPVVPMLLQEVENETGHWFTALKWITGASVVTPDMRGDVAAMREAWLKWGKECEWQNRRQKASGLENIFPAYENMTANSPASQHGITTVWDSRLATFVGGTMKSATSTTGPTTFREVTGPAHGLTR